MQHSVPSHYRRSLRAATSWLTMVGLALAVTASAAVPTLTALTVTPTSPYEATLTATVANNGGTPPIFNRGFVYSRTVDDATPERFEAGVSEILVPGTLGVMTRNLTSLIPNVSYSVQAFAENPGGTAYSGVKDFVAPCPVMTLPALAHGSVGLGYFQWLSVTGSIGGSDNYNVTGTLPPGIALTPYFGSAYLSGTPSAAGTFNFTVIVDDGYYGTGCGTFRNYSVTITAAEVSPQKLNFASELVGNSSAPKRVTITNHDGIDIPLAMPFVFTGPFSQTGTTCVDPLPVATSCTVDVVFTAPALGSYTGTLTLGPVVVSLRGAGASAVGNQVYVSNLYGDTVSVIDPATNAVRVAVPVGAGPSHLAALPGGGKVYVPNQDADSVSVISTATNTVLTTINDARLSEPRRGAHPSRR